MRVRTHRSTRLSLAMHRAMIKLNIQTPVPLVQRIPTCWYLSVLLVVLAIMAIISARAGWVYRADVIQLNGHIVLFEHEIEQQREMRRAALIALQAREDRVPVVTRGAYRQETVPFVGSESPVQTPAERPKSVARKPATRISISSRDAPLRAPESIEQAMQRLIMGRDDHALAWLMERRGGRSLRPDDWSALQRKAVTTHDAEHQYQVGVFYGLYGEYQRSARWLKRACDHGDDARYYRALGIASERLGLREQAINAYRRYLQLNNRDGSAAITARLRELESAS